MGNINNEKKQDHDREHEILTWKNPSKEEEKKSRGPASKSSLYRVRLQMPGIYNNDLIPCGGLQYAFMVVLT